MPLRVLLLLAALAPATTAAGVAQLPAERARLDSIRADLRSVGDSAVLVARERQRIAVARVERDDPFIHMELGWLSYRLGELTGNRRRYQDAASEFQWAADLRPGWPYAWYHLGLAELATGEAALIVLENIRQAIGQDFLSQAVRSFARAVEADPSFSSAIVDLATTAMRQRIGPRLEIARGALREAALTAAGRDPTVQLWRGRLERRLGAHDTSLAALRAYLALGGDSVVGLIEVARTQAQLGRVDSVRVLYLAATRSPFSAAALAEARRDLRWIAADDELAEYDAQRPDSAGAWLRRFWQGREVADGRRPGERIAEQFRRYQHAVTSYALVSRHRGNDAAFVFRDTSQSEFDDRGVIYLRHGEPSRRARHAAPGIELNETWAYRRDPPDEDLVVHFAAINDVQDFRLVESLLRICTPRWNAAPETQGFGANQATTVSGRGGGAAADVARLRAEGSAADVPGSALGACLQSRQVIGGIYERLGRPGGHTPQAWAAERQATMRGARQAVGSDSYALRFADDLAPVVSYFTVRGADGRPELHLVFAVPAARMHPVEGEGLLAYMVGLRMLVYDSTRRLVAALDTVRVFRARERFGAGAFLTEQVVLSVPPGALRYTFVVEEPHAGTGATVSGRPLEVPRLSAGFAASDVVLGREGSGLVWRRPEGPVALNPLMRFPEDGRMELFYELYGLPQGAEVGTRVRITRRGGRSLLRRVFGGAGGADLSYVTTTDAAGLTRVRQGLDLRGLGAGRYQLELELTDPVSGRQVVRSSPFEITAGPAT